MRSFNTAIFRVGSLATGWRRLIREDDTDIEELRQVVLMRAVFLVGMLLLIPFGIAALINGSPAVAVLDFSVALFLILSVFVLRRQSTYLTIANASTFVVGTLFLVLCATGGIGNTGHLWAFLFPLITLFFLGATQGSIVMAVFFAAVSIIAYVPGSQLSLTPPVFRVRYLGLLAAIWAITTCYEYIRQRMQSRYARKTAELEEALRQLSTTESALRESETKYRSLVERANEPILLLQDEVVRFANDAFMQMVRYEPEVLIGLNMKQLIAPELVERALQMYHTRMAGKPMPKTHELQILDSQGQKIDVEVNGGVIDYEGRPADLILLRDIRERKFQEQKRQNLQNHYEEVRRLESVGRLAGGIAHDFNNVLGAISGYADMMNTRFGTEEEAIGRYAGKISQGARRASELTMKLLAFARKGAFELVPINMHHLITDVTKLLKHSADKRIQIEATLRATSPVVIGDRTQLQDALLALAFNGCEAMPEGGHLRFSTETFRIKENEHGIEDFGTGVYIRVEVSDSGRGMDSETREHLFEPFYTTKEPGGGTGLGMASVYGTVKGIKGAIDVKSGENRGTTIRITLPCAEDILPGDEQPAPEKVSSEGNTVLVIEDEECLRDVCTQILRSMGREAHCCIDGAEAVEYFQQHAREVRLVVLDQAMPRLNGYQCFCRMRKVNPGIRVVIMTGDPYHPDVKRMLNEGADGLVRKPFDVNEFKTLIRELTADTAGTTSWGTGEQ